MWLVTWSAGALFQHYTDLSRTDNTPITGLHFHCTLHNAVLKHTHRHTFFHSHRGKPEDGFNQPHLGAVLNFDGLINALPFFHSILLCLPWFSTSLKSTLHCLFSLAISSFPYQGGCLSVGLWPSLYPSCPEWVSIMSVSLYGTWLWGIDPLW